MIEIKENSFVINNSGDYENIKAENIEVNNNSIVNIYDSIESSIVNVNVEEGSTVNYFIVNSSNTKRIFNVDGILNVIEINIKETNDNLIINLNKENAEGYVKNLVVSNNINSTFIQSIIHNSPYTFSNIENVGISFLGGNITFDTTGKIEKGKSKSKCAQLSRGIVMDNKSTVTAKPILLIDEFDCFANHGASIGKMSDDDLFYLMSRGLTKDEAFLLILQGMVKPFVDSIPNEKLRNKVENNVNDLILR